MTFIVYHLKIVFIQGAPSFVISLLRHFTIIYEEKAQHATRYYIEVSRITP